jgi:hypothetical protein
LPLGSTRTARSHAHPSAQHPLLRDQTAAHEAETRRVKRAKELKNTGNDVRSDEPPERHKFPVSSSRPSFLRALNDSRDALASNARGAIVQLFSRPWFDERKADSVAPKLASRCAAQDFEPPALPVESYAACGRRR